MFNSLWNRTPNGQQKLWVPPNYDTTHQYYLNFDKVDDSVQCLPKSNINCYDPSVLNAPFSFFAWVYTIDAGEGTLGTICYKDQSTSGTDPSQGYKFHVFALSSSKLKLGANLRSGDGTDAQRATSATTNSVLPINGWHQVGFVFNDDGTKKIKIYLDGVNQSLSTQTACTGDVLDDSNLPLYIGNRWRGDVTFNGRIRDVMVFKGVALNATEVANLFTGTIPASITARYDFHEGRGFALHDIIGGAHGTLGRSTGTAGGTFIPGGSGSGTTWGIYS